MVAEAAAVLGGDARDVVSALHARMSLLAGQERFEDAGAVRDRMLHLVRAAARAQRLAPLAASPEVVAARRTRRRRLGGRLRPLRPARRDDDHAPAAPTRCRSSRALTATAEVVAPGSRARARGDARGDREDPALARGAGRADRRARGRVDLPGARCRRGPRPPRAPGRRAARRGGVRRAGVRRPVAAAHRPARRPATAFGSRGADNRGLG